MPGKFINSGTNPFGKVTLTNNSNAGNLSISTPGSTTYTIGQAALGGIIAYITGGGSTGTSGFVVTSTDVSIGAPWGCSGTTIGSTSAAIGTGNQNTIDIMAGCATAGIAARLCGDLSSGGFSDWYLPSKDELNALYTNRTAIGGFDPGQYYWSSTEFSSTDAWLQNLTTGLQVNDGKSSTYNVRAVRSF